MYNVKLWKFKLNFVRWMPHQFIWPININYHRVMLYIYLNYVKPRCFISRWYRETYLNEHFSSHATTTHYAQWIALKSGIPCHINYHMRRWVQCYSMSKSMSKLIFLVACKFTETTIKLMKLCAACIKHTR